MPLIIKSLSVDAASFAELSDDENDYIKDPDQLRDLLPMPFRMIDKVLSNLIDDAWETIIVRENERVAEKSKVRPPKYECGINVHALRGVTSMCESVDGRYVFAVFRGGIHVIDASSRRLISTWEEANIEFSNVQCVLMGSRVYLLATVDVSGVVRLLACAGDRIYVLKTMSEELTARHLLAVKCDVSKEGDFAGVSLQNVHTKDCSLEVYQLPRDAWLKELETAAGFQGQSVAADGTAVPADSGSLEQTSQSAALSIQPEGSSTAIEAVAGEVAVPIVFSQPTAVLRVRPPAKFTPNLATSPAQAYKDISDNRVILLGTGTLLTRAYSEVRKEMFQEANAEVLSHLPSPQSSDKLSEATVHFVTPGVVLPYGIEQPGILSRPTSVAIWWSGSNLVSLYCLTRPPKAKKTNEPTETEFDLKPEAVWPQAAKITASCVTVCTALLALGLESGAVIVWDKQLGAMRKCVNVSKHPITKLEFLNPSICSQANNSKRIYPTTTSFHVLVWCGDSSLYTLNCGLMDQASPVCVRPSAQTDDEVLTHVSVLSGISELVVQVQKNGAMFLLDVTTAGTLCEIAMPATHELATPWQPVMALPAFGQLLYVKGERKAIKSSYEHHMAPGEDEPVFAFQLRSFPTLDRYWKKKRADVTYTTSSTIDVRVAALLTHRVKSSAARKQRLEQRWPQMKQELLRITAMKQVQ